MAPTVPPLKRYGSLRASRNMHRARLKDPKYLKAVQDSENSLNTLQAFLRKQDGNLLQTWLRTFDTDHNLRVTEAEFCREMANIGFEGNAESLFERIDVDNSGELTLDEIDASTCRLWMRFRMWCAGKFNDPKDMMMRIGSEPLYSLPVENLHEKTFIDGCLRNGWEGDEVELALIFQSLDTSGRRVISKDNLAWFAQDKKKQTSKEQARIKALKEQAHNLKERKQIDDAVQHFRAFVKQRYSTFLRAWRCVLDIDGSMTVQKHEVFKAVKDIRWDGDMRLLWKGFDKDNSGVTSLQELDLRTAERLAKFKEFATRMFGSVVNAFYAFDTKRKGKLKETEFLDACKDHGFNKMTRALFHGLDWKGNKFIRSEDLSFLDTWRCQEYLICEPNAAAAQEFKAALLGVYHNYMKAWRVCLDRDNSNRVAWEEFEACANRIRFKGDRPGAWRHLDDDVSGFVSLREIDEESFNIVTEFRHWADKEFGSVKSAFGVICPAGEMSFRQFRNALVAFAYQGDLKLLFNLLDTDGQGALSLDEVAFIDEWEKEPDEELAAVMSAHMSQNKQEPPASASTRKKRPSTNCSPRILELALPRGHAQPPGLEVSNSQKTLGVSSSQKTLGVESCDFLRPKRLKSPYAVGWLPGIGKSHMSATAAAGFPGVPSGNRIETLKDAILRLPLVPQDTDAWRGVEFGHDLASIKSKTAALRNRTIELLGKTDHLDLKCAAGTLQHGSFQQDVQGGL